MNENVATAKRLIAAFMALMLGRPIPIRWGAGSAGMGANGEVHLPQPMKGDAEEIALLTRLAVHEGGHKAYTVPGWNERLDSSEVGIFNAIEDPRIEACQAVNYPGAKVILARGLGTMLDTIQERLDGDEVPHDLLLQLDLLFRGLLAAAPTPPLRQRASRLLYSTAAKMSDDERSIMATAACAVPGLASSLDAEALARTVVGRLAQLNEPPQAPDSTDAPEASGQSEKPADSEDEQAQKPPAEEGEASEAADQHDSSSTGDEASDAASNTNEQHPDAGGDTHRELDQPDSSSAPGGDEQGGAGGSGEAGSTDGEGALPEQPNPSGEEEKSSGAGGGDEGSGQQSADGSTSSGTPASGSHQTPDNSGAKEGSAVEQPNANCRPEAAADEQDAVGTDSVDSAKAGDLGELLRQTHEAMYGKPEAFEAEPVEQPTIAGEADRARLAVLLASDVPEGADLEQLIAQATAIVVPPGAAESEAGDGAGFTLAGHTGSGSYELGNLLNGLQSRLVGVLRREFQDKRHRPTKAAVAGPRVMAGRFWRLKALCDTKVMAQKQPVQGIDAAVSLLLDKSSSMHDELDEAAEVTFAFSLACQRLGRVKTRVAVFPGPDNVVDTLQHFGESSRLGTRRARDLVASGGTPVGRAVLDELNVLAARREPRKWLIVITDDEPGDPPVLAAALARASTQGVTVIGIGIRCNVARYYSRSISLADVTELPSALADLFRESMVEELLA